jgi:hypothetical protein
MDVGGWNALGAVKGCNEEYKVVAGGSVLVNEAVCVVEGGEVCDRVVHRDAHT